MQSSPLPMSVVKHILLEATRFNISFSRSYKWSSFTPGKCFLINSASLRIYSALCPFNPAVSSTCVAISGSLASPIHKSFVGLATYRRTFIEGPEFGWKSANLVAYPPNLHSLFERYGRAASPEIAKATPWTVLWKRN